MNSNSHKIAEEIPLKEKVTNSDDKNSKFHENDTQASLVVEFVDSNNAVHSGEDPEGGKRVQWGSKMDFLLSTIGFAVDLSNVFRFPTTCYYNGGGAFLVPYLIMLLFCALPLFYMELILGQYNKQGCISIWDKICPALKGIGWGACVMNFYVALFYNSVIAWSFHYLFSSFTSQLPWTRCDHTFNTDACWNENKRLFCQQLMNPNASILIDNYTIANDNILSSMTIANCTTNMTRLPSATEYFENNVLGLKESGGFHDIKGPKWDLSLCLLLTFVLLYISLFKGVKSMGYAVWITAILPYAVLAVLLVRGLTLQGATSGILYFITPDFTKLKNLDVWSAAAVQIFFSIGSGFGVHLAYSSYNDFHNNVLKDCVIATCVNSFTSLFSGFVVFAYLGYMSFKNQVNIENVVSMNSGLVFTVYPEALATLPGAPFWSIIFFVMLMTLGLDSSFGALEALITAVTDEFKKYIVGYKYSREVTTGVACLIIYLCALPNVCYGGLYVYRFLEEYGAGVTILISVVVQCIGVSWFYGMDKFTADIEEMMGFKPNVVWRLLWKYFTPAILMFLSCYSLTKMGLPDLQLSDGTWYTYPSWTIHVAWVVIMSSASLIPIFAVIQFIKLRGKTLRETIAKWISPAEEHEEIRRTGEVKRFKLKHWAQLL